MSATFKKQQAAVIAGGNGELQYRFARDNGAHADLDRPALQAAVIASGNPWAQLSFATFPCLDEEERAALQTAVIASDNPWVMGIFACNIPSADRDALRKAIIRCDGGKGFPTDFRVPLDRTNMALYRELVDAVIASGNASIQLLMAQAHACSGRDELRAFNAPLQKAVIDSGDSMMQYKFAKELPVNDVEVSELQFAVIASGNKSAQRLFAYHVECADVAALWQSVCAGASADAVEVFNEALVVMRPELIEEIGAYKLKARTKKVAPKKQKSAPKKAGKQKTN